MSSTLRLRLCLGSDYVPLVNAYCNIHIYTYTYAYIIFIFHFFNLFFINQTGRGCKLLHGCLSLWHALARVCRVCATPNAQLTPAHRWTQAGLALASIVAVMISQACNAKTCHVCTAGYMQTKTTRETKNYQACMCACGPDTRCPRVCYLARARMSGFRG